MLLFSLIKINSLGLVMSSLDDYLTDNEDPNIKEKEKELLDGDDGDGDEEPMDVGDGGGVGGDQAQQQQESAAKGAPPPPPGTGGGTKMSEMVTGMALRETAPSPSRASRVMR